MKKFDPTTKAPRKIKFRCHQLMVEIWGDSKKDRDAAYRWLRENFHYDVHFSTLEDEVLLKEIFEALWIKSFKKAQKSPELYLHESL